MLYAHFTMRVDLLSIRPKPLCPPATAPTAQLPFVSLPWKTDARSNCIEASQFETCWTQQRSNCCDRSSVSNVTIVLSCLKKNPHCYLFLVCSCLVALIVLLQALDAGKRHLKGWNSCGSNEKQTCGWQWPDGSLRWLRVTFLQPYYFFFVIPFIGFCLSLRLFEPCPHEIASAWRTLCLRTINAQIHQCCTSNGIPKRPTQKSEVSERSEVSKGKRIPTKIVPKCPKWFFRWCNAWDRCSELSILRSLPACLMQAQLRDHSEACHSSIRKFWLRKSFVVLYHLLLDSPKRCWSKKWSKKWHICAIWVATQKFQLPQTAESRTPTTAGASDQRIDDSRHFSMLTVLLSYKGCGVEIFPERKKPMPPMIFTWFQFWRQIPLMPDCLKEFLITANFLWFLTQTKAPWDYNKTWYEATFVFHLQWTCPRSKLVSRFLRYAKNLILGYILSSRFVKPCLGLLLAVAIIPPIIVSVVPVIIPVLPPVVIPVVPLPVVPPVIIPAIIPIIPSVTAIIMAAIFILIVFP